MAITFNAAGAVVSGDAVTTLTPTAPAGTASTDIVLVVLTFSQGITATTFTPPAGWTLANRLSPAAGSLDQAVYWGLGSATFGDWAPVSLSSVIVAFTLGYIGVDNTTPMDATAVSQANASAALVTAPSITTVTDNAWLVGFFGWDDLAVGPAPTWSLEFGTPRQNGSLVGLNDTTAVDAADLAQAVAGASGTRTATASIAMPNVGTLVALRPAITVTIMPVPIIVRQAVNRASIF